MSRETAGASVVVSAILRNWDRLIPETQEQLKHEAENEATCNFEDWQRVIDR